MSFLCLFFKSQMRTKLQSSWKNINHIWIRYLNGDWCLENDVIQGRTVDYDIWVKGLIKMLLFQGWRVLSQTETWVKEAIKVLLLQGVNPTQLDWTVNQKGPLSIALLFKSPCMTTTQWEVISFWEFLRLISTRTAYTTRVVIYCVVSLLGMCWCSSWGIHKLWLILFDWILV